MGTAWKSSSAGVVPIVFEGRFVMDKRCTVADVERKIRLAPRLQGKLVYQGKLPRMNVERPDWRRRWNLKQACLRQFGIMPVPATQVATVTITRVLGPREKLMDTANLSYALKGLEDSLTNRRPKKHGRGYAGGGNYIVDDAPQWATFTYLQDATRRAEGPAVEVVILYVQRPD